MDFTYKRRVAKRSLLECCERNDTPEVESRIMPLRKEIEELEEQGRAAALENKKDALLVQLFVDEHDEDTPVEAALRIGSGRDKGANISLRLFLLDCLVACGPVLRFEKADKHPAHVRRIADSMHSQMLLFLIRLGALARPYVLDSASPDADAVSASPDSIRVPMMKFCLETMQELSHHELALTVAAAFHVEYDEFREVHGEWKQSEESKLKARQQGRSLKTLMAKRKGLLPSTFPNDRDRGRLGMALRTSLRLAHDAEKFAEMLEVSMNLYDAAKQRELSRRLQLAAATALDSLGDDLVYLILRHRRGYSGLSLATIEGMKAFCSSGAVRGAVRRIWVGEKLYHLLDSPSVGLSLAYAAWAVYNILLMPIIAATPMISHRRNDPNGWLVAFGGVRENYLLQVASFQAVIFQVLDLGLTLYLTFAPSFYPAFGFLWGLSAFWYELRQVAEALGEEQSSLSSYLQIDLFNWLDVPSLALITASFGIEALSSDTRAGLGVDSITNALAWVGLAGDGAADSGSGLVEGRRLRGGRGGNSLVSSPSGGVNGNLSGNLGEGEMDGTASLAYVGVQVLSLAMLFAWLRQLRFLGLMSSGMSDLIQMLASMLLDVIKFMALFLVVLIAFGASLAHLITETDVALASPECAEPLGRLDTVTGAVVLLFEDSLLGDVNGPLVCMRQNPHHGQLGVAIIFVFMIVSILMLLNMIIAIMGQTFADYYAGATESSALYFARVVGEWEGQAQLPPLVNLLGLPWSLCVMIAQTIMRAARCVACIVDQTAAMAPSEAARQLTTAAYPGTTGTGTVAGTGTGGGTGNGTDGGAGGAVGSALAGAPRPGLANMKGHVTSKSFANMDFSPLHEDDEDDELDDMPTRNEIMRAIEGTLESQCGQWASTEAIIDNAVNLLTAEVHDVRALMRAAVRLLGADEATVLRQPLRQESVAAKIALGMKSPMDDAATDAAPPAAVPPAAAASLSAAPPRRLPTGRRAMLEAPPNRSAAADGRSTGAPSPKPGVGEAEYRA